MPAVYSDDEDIRQIIKNSSLSILFLYFLFGLLLLLSTDDTEMLLVMVIEVKSTVGQSLLKVIQYK